MPDQVVSFSILDGAVQMKEIPAHMKEHLERTGRWQPLFSRYVAEQKINQHWSAAGGAGSRLGLPWNEHESLQLQSGRYIRHYRGGTISVARDGSDLREDAYRQVRFTFEGLVLDMRQEKSMDDIYGAFGYRLGSHGAVAKFDIPEVQLGGKDKRNQRVWKTSQQIYSGPPANLELFVEIVERDHGNKDVVRGKIKEAIDKGSQAAFAAAGGAGGFIGEAASASGLGGTLRDIGVGVLSKWLGLADDPYNPAGMTISAHDMVSAPLREHGNRLDDKVIHYTHKLQCNGTDDRGDEGQITACFRVWQ